MANQIIEEMSQDLYEAWRSQIIIGNKYEWVMERLYNKGYRKIPENAVVLTGDEYETEKQMAKYWKERAQMWKQCTYDIRKETAKKFAKTMRDCYPPREDTACTLDDCYMLDRIDEICKEFTES